MIQIRTMAHIGIRVENFERSVAFFSNFGFNVTREDYHEHVLALKHTSGIELNLLDSVTDNNEGRNILMDEMANYPGYTHLALRVDDIQQTIAAVQDLHIDITEGPVTFGDSSTSIFIRDPDRNVIELSQASTAGV